MLTLTSRRYLYTLDRLWLAYDEFNRLMHRHFGKRWKYVAVPELHPTNNDHYHVHIAIRGHYPVDVIRYLWRKALRSTIENAASDHTPGGINIRYKKHIPAHRRVGALARYISKYLSKSIGENHVVNRKRYEKSRGLDPHVVKLFAPLTLMNDLDIIRKVQEISGGTLSRNPIWETYGGYDCLLIETEPTAPD